MADYKTACKNLAPLEGGYVNDPSDPGGETNFGITKKYARSAGYTGEMKDMTREEAERILKPEFWDKQRLGEIPDQEIAENLFEIGVNLWITTAGRILQEAINLLSESNLKVDGWIGQRTLEALNRIKDKRILNKCINGLQFEIYHKIVLEHPERKKFLPSFLRRV